MTDMNMNQDKERLAQRRAMLKKRLQRKQRQQEQLNGEGLELAQYGNYGKGAFHNTAEDPE